MDPIHVQLCYDRVLFYRLFRFTFFLERRVAELTLCDRIATNTMKQEKEATRERERERREHCHLVEHAESHRTPAALTTVDNNYSTYLLAEAKASTRPCDQSATCMLHKIG